MADIDYQAMMRQQDLEAGYRDMDKWFLEKIYEQVRPFTMTGIERMYDMYKSVEYISKARVFGDIVECGVWRGGSMMIAAKTLIHLKDTERHLWLYDTFTGLPKPEDDEPDIKGNKGIDFYNRFAREDGTSDACRAEIDETKANLASTGYPEYLTFYVQGMVEETTKNISNLPISVALLRIDTDWYPGAKACIETFWPLLPKGGILIMDDYGNFLGQKRALDEYFEQHGITDKLTRTDYSGRTVIKSR